MERDLPTLRLGTPLAGRYRLDQELGRGGMGVVYRAWDEEVGEAVALKVLPPLARDADRSRFRREVRLARRVTHPNVARTHDLGTDGDHWFLTMELVEGEALSALLRREKRLPAERTVPIAKQIALALGAAHDAGVLHRDLKPGNVLVEPAGRAVLTDFGIASAVAGEDETTGIAGTPAYMAPEQVRGEETGPRTDLYSFGVVLFELVTGTKPFRGPSAQAVAYARLRADPPDPRTLAPVPDPLADLILSLLARDPASRPASAHAIVETLRGGTQSEPSARAALGPLRVRVPALRWLGPPDGAWLADAMTAALQHDLARTSGLEVVLDGDLPTAFTVSGTVLRSQDRVRVSVQLSAEGSVRWTETLDADVADVLVLQETLAGRIAETLRVVIAVRGRASAPREVVEQYLRVRGRTRTATLELPHLLPELEGLRGHEAIHRPVVALEALVRASLYWIGRIQPERDRLALEAVSRATREAPDEPDTHVAEALVAVADGRFPEAVAALGRATAIAPGAARPQAMLGLLECEADRRAEGIARLRRAVGLDPDLKSAWMEIVRQQGLDGDCDGALALLARGIAGEELPIVMLRTRLALWGGRDDFPALARETVERSRTDPSAPRSGVVALEAALGHVPVASVLPALEISVAEVRPRFGALIAQIATELLASMGATEAALAALQHAADLPLVDLGWLDRCPCLEPLRDLPPFEDVRRRVRVRSGRVWTG